ncbi:MAG: alpha/beta hydrolase [Pyrinomonadaceae bacterium]
MKNDALKSTHIFLFLLLISHNTYSQTIGAKIRGQPFERYFTKDKFDRKITFYLSETADKNAVLPLVVFIQGSGCNSLFIKKEERIVSTAGFATIYDVFQDKARLLVIEKPGVNFLDDPADCRQNTEFNREHTLERWAGAIEAAISASVSLPRIRNDNALIIGHSEGGLAAARAARDLPEKIGFAALLAGGGNSQLFDLISLARKGYFFGNISEAPEVRVRYVTEEWQKILEDPMSSDKFFFGFAYRRWSSFLKTSPLEELKDFKGKVYIGQGTADKAVDPASADALNADLLASAKDVFYSRVENADHSFNIENDPAVNGWRKQFEQISKWFLSADR